MATVVYDNEIIENHSFYSICGSTLNNVSHKDYPNTNYFNPDIKCLDMDKYETSMTKGSENNTMDAAVGIGDWDGKLLKQQRLLLIELRLKYKSTNNLSSSELIKKDEHTRQLLAGTASLDAESYFIFNNNINEQVKSWLNRQKNGNGRLKRFKSLSETELNEQLKDRTNYPYKPEVSSIDVSNDLFTVLNDKDKFFHKIKHWINKANNFGNNNKQTEQEIIQTVLKKAWKNFRKSNPSLNDDDEINAEIIEEDNDWIIES